MNEEDVEDGSNGDNLDEQEQIRHLEAQVAELQTDILLLRSRLAGAELLVEPLEKYHAADVKTIDRQRELNIALNEEIVRLRPAARAPAARRPLPQTRASVTHKFDVGGHTGYVTVGLYPGGQPGELFVVMSKQGSTIGGLLDAFGRMASLALQWGMPVADLVEKLRGSTFEPMGYTGSPDVPFAKSVIDYIARWIGLRFGAGEDVLPLTAAPAPIGGSAPAQLTPRQDASGPPCRDCGTLTVPSGKCHCCPQCGSTTGCS